MSDANHANRSEGNGNVIRTKRGDVSERSLCKVDEASRNGGSSELIVNHERGRHAETAIEAKSKDDSKPEAESCVNDTSASDANISRNTKKENRNGTRESKREDENDQPEDRESLLGGSKGNNVNEHPRSDGRRAEDPGIFEPPEGGWGWLVCLASFWTNGTLFGILNVFGILYVEFLEEFKDQGDEVYFKLSWIGALEVATTFFMSLFSSILVDLFGIQLISGIGAVIATSGMLVSSFVHSIELLYVTYGILIGLGSSLVYTPSMTILGHYFRKRLGLVNGMVAFGSAVFTFVLSTTLPVLLRSIGLRNTMRVMCVMLGMLGLCPFIWRPIIPKQTVGLDAIKSTESLHRAYGGCVRKLRRIVNVDMFRNRGYRIWIIGVPIAFMGYFIPFVHIVEHTKQVFPGCNAEILVMCIGGISGVSRLISGKLADFPQFSRVRIMQFAFLLLGVATSLIPYAGYYGVLVFLTCAMGIADGCFVCMIGPIAYDLLGPHGMGQGIGVLLGSMSVPMTIGPPLAGFLRGILGTYKIAFLIAGLPPIIGSCILFLMPPSTNNQLPEITENTLSLAKDNEDLDEVDQQDKEIIKIKLVESPATGSEGWPQSGSDVTVISPN